MFGALDAVFAGVRERTTYRVAAARADVPEMPEIQAHAERLTAEFAGRVLTRFVPINFTALKTAVPAPDTAYGEPLEASVGEGKYLLLDFEPSRRSSST